MVNSLYQKRGGHCFFIFKSGVIPENTRFLIKNGVSDLTLPVKGRKAINVIFRSGFWGGHLPLLNYNANFTYIYDAACMGFYIVPL